MNKSELVAAVGAGADLTKQQAERAVDSLVAAVMSEVKAGNKVTLIGFGVFNPTARAARTGRNPQTGAPVKIAASKGVRFAAGRTFKLALNSKGGAKKAVATKAPAKRAAPKATAKKLTAPAKKAPAKKAPAKKATTRPAATRPAAKKAVTKKVTAARKTIKKAVAKKR
ncbi:MAG: HU family DNA-binding protein [Acidimicrobiales bacterium]